MPPKPQPAPQDEEFARLRQRLLEEDENQLKAAGERKRLVTYHGAEEPVFTAQPYPLFLADWSDGDPLYGRIVGWSTEGGQVPIPVVAFEYGGHTNLPIRVDMATAMQRGPVWIRDSLEEARAAVDAHRAQRKGPA